MQKVPFNFMFSSEVIRPEGCLACLYSCCISCSVAHLGGVVFQPGNVRNILRCGVRVSGNQPPRSSEATVWVTIEVTECWNKPVELHVIPLHLVVCSQSQVRLQQNRDGSIPLARHCQLQVPHRLVVVHCQTVRLPEKTHSVFDLSYSSF